MKRAFYFILGCLSLLTGVIGILLPVLPTVPLVLLAAWCFSRSSERFRIWITEHRYFGPIIEKYKDGKIERKIKISIVLLITLSISISIYIIPLAWVKYGLLVIGLSVSLYIITREEPSDT